MKKRTMTLVISLLLVALVAVGGTLAWLMDSTDTVTNTFTAGNVNIELDETTGDTYKMVPGNDIDKDPFVTVKANSEASYVYVKIDRLNNFDNFMTFEIADGWTALEGVTDVYYREVAASDADQNFAVLKNDTVKVKGTVTKEMMDALTEANQPKLAFTAYAIQSDNIADAAAGWAELNPAPAN